MSWLYFLFCLFVLFCYLLYCVYLRIKDVYITITETFIDRTSTVLLCLRQKNQADNEFSGPRQRVLMMPTNVLLRSLLFRRFSWDVSTAGIHMLPGKRRHSQQETRMLVPYAFHLLLQSYVAGDLKLALFVHVT